MMTEKKGPTYKIGDTVTIAKRTQSGEDYRYCFVDEMTLMEGKSLVVIGVKKATLNPTSIPDDGYYYELRGSTFKWVSSMFESSSPFTRRKRRPKLNFKL